MKKLLSASLVCFGFALITIFTTLSASAQSPQQKNTEYEGVYCWIVIHGRYTPSSNTTYNCWIDQKNVEITYQDIYKRGLRLVGTVAIPDTNTSPQSNGIGLYFERRIK